MPKPSKHDQLMEATKELLWDMGYACWTLVPKRAADVRSYTDDAFHSIGDLRDWIASA